MNDNNENNASQAEAFDTKIDKILKCGSKVDNFIDRFLGLIGDHPWDKWLKSSNQFISKYIPIAMGIAGILACLTGLVLKIKEDEHISDILNTICMLVPALFAMHLAPKALALARSIIEKSEPVLIRPELMSILRVIFGLGGFLVAVYFFLHFESSAFAIGLGFILFATVMTIAFSHPELVGVKAGYPTNCTEELIDFIMLPVRIIIALLTLLVGIAVVAGIIFGIYSWFADGGQPEFVLYATAIGPFAVPLALYLSYIAMMYVFDFFKAIASVPRKLDELKK